MANYFFLSSILLFSSIAWAVQLQTIYEFPNNTCLENLALRPDGSILTTLTTAPEVWMIQPSAQNPNPQLVHKFDGATSALGIHEEPTPDSFQVVTVSLKGLSPVPGTAALWRIKFSTGSNSPTVTLIAKLPDVTLPNGMVVLNDDLVLVAESVKGEVYSVNTTTGASKMAISDPLFKNTEYSTDGINGLQLRGNILYFTSTGQKVFGKVTIDCSTGAALGPASVIATQFPGPAIFAYDDFAIGPAGRFAFAATAGGNSIERINLATGEKAIIAGNINSTQIAQPTSAIFARTYPRTLYVATAGGFEIPVNGYEVIGGQLLAMTFND